LNRRTFTRALRGEQVTCPERSPRGAPLREAARVDWDGLLIRPAFLGNVAKLLGCPAGPCREPTGIVRPARDVRSDAEKGMA
jgi:hypothetical protein